MGGDYQWYGNSNLCWLAGTEGNDAPDRIVRRNADGDSIARNDFNAEAAHSTAELGQHLVTGVALHAIQSAAVHRDDGALHVNQIILAQLLACPFFQTNIVPHLSFGYLVIWLIWSFVAGTQAARASGARLPRPGTQR